MKLKVRTRFGVAPPRCSKQAVHGRIKARIGELNSNESARNRSGWLKVDSPGENRVGLVGETTDSVSSIDGAQFAYLPEVADPASRPLGTPNNPVNSSQAPR